MLNSSKQIANDLFVTLSNNCNLTGKIVCYKFVFFFCGFTNNQ